MYRSNRSFNIPLPPPGPIPGIWHLCRRRRREFDSQSLSGGWGIWTAPSISYEISRVASYHGRRGFRGFSWKRLCLCGQLVTRKGLKQALYRIWRYLNINIFNIGFRLWIYECIKLCLQWNTIPILAIQYNNKKLNRGQLLWPAACMLINKVSDDACQWICHDIVISIDVNRWDFF